MIFTQEEVRALQQGNPDANLWICIHGSEDRWLFGTRAKILCVRFRGRPAGECTIPFIEYMMDGSDEKSMFVSQAGWEALTGDWCGRPAISSMAVSLRNNQEVLQLRDAGATLVP